MSFCRLAISRPPVPSAPFFHTPCIPAYLPVATQFLIMSVFPVPVPACVGGIAHLVGLDTSLDLGDHNLSILVGVDTDRLLISFFLSSTSKRIHTLLLVRPEYFWEWKLVKFPCKVSYCTALSPIPLSSSTPSHIFQYFDPPLPITNDSVSSFSFRFQGPTINPDPPFHPSSTS